jgi:hypothetical protein
MDGAITRPGVEMDVLLEETKVQAEEKGHDVRLVSSTAPTVPLWAVYMTTDNELCTHRVMLLNIYEASYRDRGRLERYPIVCPVVFEPDGSLEEEEGYCESFLGLSLGGRPDPADWQRQIKEYHARRR